MELKRTYNQKQETKSCFVNLMVGCRPVTSLGHPEGRKVFWEGTKFFQLCPIILNYVQHIVQWEKKIF